MKEYLVKIPEGQEEVLVAVMEKYGAEVEAISAVSTKSANSKKPKQEDSVKNFVNKPGKKVSTTWLFGKWKDLEINPESFRKEVWRRK